MNAYIEKVKDSYSKDENKYHTIHHIENIFELYKKYRNEFLSEFPDLNENELFESMAWHDSVYIIGSKCNEELSAELYKKMNDSFNQKIYFAIISTKIGHKTFNNPIEKVLHDLDWSGFMNYDIMVENEKKILYEATCNGLYTVDFAKQNQKKFYESFANKDIYITKTFQKFNKIARENLQKRIVEM